MTDLDLPDDLRLAALRYLNKTPPGQRTLRLSELSMWLKGRDISNGEIDMLLTYLRDHRVEFLAD